MLLLTGKAIENPHLFFHLPFQFQTPVLNFKPTPAMLQHIFTGNPLSGTALYQKPTQSHGWRDYGELNRADRVCYHHIFKKLTL